MIIVVFGAFQFIAVMLQWRDVQAGFSCNDSVGMVVLFCPAEALAALGDLGEVEVVCNLNDHFVSLSSLSPNHQFIRFLQILCRNRRIQLPRDIHRLFTFVFHIVGSAEICVSFRSASNSIRFELPDK